MKTVELAQIQAKLISAMATMKAIKAEQIAQAVIANASAPAMKRTFKYKGNAL